VSLFDLFELSFDGEIVSFKIRDAIWPVPFPEPVASPMEPMFLPPECAVFPILFTKSVGLSVLVIVSTPECAV
jgi:hypothetical protein